MKARIIWTEERIEAVKVLWALGTSTAEIGRKIGVTKNAVVGKAHRLELEARPSPIKRGGAKKEIAPAPAVTLPALLSAPEPEQMAIAQVQNRYLAPENITEVEDPQEKPENLEPKPTAKVVLFKPLTHPCCWPLGDPRKPGFKFCGRHALTGHPYCQTHFEAAYLPRRKKTDSAA